jgi:hypothetical protein
MEKFNIDVNISEQKSHAGVHLKCSTDSVESLADVVALVCVGDAVQYQFWTS